MNNFEKIQLIKCAIEIGQSEPSETNMKLLVEKAIKKYQKVQKKRSYGTVHELTDKEKEIVQAICEKGITKIYKLAQCFCLSEATIQTHLKGIYSKCFVNSIADLMFQYYKKRGEQ